MERRGISGRRGYLWPKAVLVIVLLIVVYLGMRQQPVYSSQMPLPSTAADSASAAPAPSRHTAAGARPYSHRRPYANPAPEPTPEKIFRKSSRVVVELNSADSLDLVQLYNIGPAYAKRILKYRTALGGFVEKSQLWEVYGMDSARYNSIAPYVSVDAGNIRQIDINTATIDDLKRHPYLDYYQAKAIVQLREKVGLFTHIDDLKQVALLDIETFNKIHPYLLCNLQPNK